MSNDKKQNEKEEREDWLGKLIFWLSIGAVVFGITTFLGYFDKHFKLDVTSDNIFFIELCILVALVVWASLDGLFGKK